MSSGARFGIAVESTAPELAQLFGRIAEEQLPFAQAVALTRLAQLSREAVLGRLPRDGFTIRSSRVLKGVRVVRAEKRDFPKSRAQVALLDEFMADHVLGRQRTGRGRRIAVRSDKVKLTGTGAVPKAKKPRQLIAQGTAFERRGTLFVRPRRRRTGEPEVVPMYFLRGRVKIEPRWEYVSTVEGEVGAKYDAAFRAELEAAIKSARARAGHLSEDHARVLYFKARKALGGTD